MALHENYRVIRLISGVGFLLLFPGFFVYHLSVTSGWVPSFAGGLFGPVTVGLTCFFVLCSDPFFKMLGSGSRGLVFVFLSLMFYSVVWVGINHSFLALSYLNEASAQAIGLLFAWVALFFVGAGLDFKAAYFVRALWVGFAIMIFATAFLFDVDRMMFNPRATYDVEDGVATYQGYARSALLCSLLLLASANKFSVRLGIFFVSLILLFALGARSELFGFIAIVALFLFVEATKSTKRFAVYVLFVLCSVAVIGSRLDDFMSSRQAEVLDLSDSTSWAGRTHYLTVALGQIWESPLLGKYAGHFEAGGTGTYAHNILSSWVEFGFVGFLIYGFLCVYCFFVSFGRFVKNSEFASIWASAFLVNGVSLLLVAISKPVFWSAPALGWGLVAGAMLAEKKMGLRKRQ